MSTRPLAITAAKEVEDLWLKGVSFERAVRHVRPKYASAVKKLRKFHKTNIKIGGTK